MGGYATGNFLLPPTVRTPSRTLNSAGFQPNANRPCWVTYSVRIVSVSSVTGGQQGLVQLLSDSNATPTTARAQGRGGQTGTLSIGLTVQDDTVAIVKYLVPAGDYVIIKTTNVTGTPTYTFEVQTEEDL